MRACFLVFCLCFVAPAWAELYLNGQVMGHLEKVDGGTQTTLSPLGSIGLKFTKPRHNGLAVELSYSPQNVVLANRNSTFNARATGRKHFSYLMIRYFAGAFSIAGGAAYVYEHQNISVNHQAYSSIYSYYAYAGALALNFIRTKHYDFVLEGRFISSPESDYTYSAGLGLRLKL